MLRTIELRLTPDRKNEGGTILAFETKAGEHFCVNQSESFLELQWPAEGYRHHYLWVPDTFQRGRPVVITLVSGENGTAVYVDGALKRRHNGFRFSASELAGRLVVGSSFAGSSWTGDLHEVALYNRAFTAQEVRDHAGARSGDILARYLFDEGAGRVVSDKGPRHLDLVIPPRFGVLSREFLHPFWRQDFLFNHGFWEDVLLNIFGFIPFGFVVCAYLAETRRVAEAIRIAILFGFLVSLTIESVQVFLPTRSSDSRDLLTNVVGTIIGVAAYRYRPLRSLYERAVDRVIRMMSRPAAGASRTLRAVRPEVAPDVAAD